MEWLKKLAESSHILSVAVSMISSVGTTIATLAQIPQTIDGYKDKADSKKLKNLSADINYQTITKDLEPYYEAVDDYLGRSRGQNLISESDKGEFLDSFFQAHPEMLPYRDRFTPIIQQYLFRLEELLQKCLSEDALFLNGKIQQLLEMEIEQGDISRIIFAVTKDIQDTSHEIQEMDQRVLSDEGEIKEKLYEISATVTAMENRIEDLQKQLAPIAAERKQPIEIKSFILINKKFIDEHRTEDVKEQNLIRLTYHNGKSSSEVIFKAVINQINEHTSEYESICDQVYHLAMNSSPVFLMANCGSGKSTLLCEIALKAAADGFDVYYYCGGDIPNNLEINGQVFFLIDNASEHQELIERLYKSNNNNVHIIAVDRTHRIQILLENCDVPLWITKARGVILENDSKTKCTILREKNILRILIPESLKKVVTDAAISSVIEYEELRSDIRIPLTYKNKSYTDVIMDYCLGYNKKIGEESITIKRHVWDWDVWDDNKELKGTFQYVAALYSCGIRPTPACFSAMTGVELITIIKEGKLPVISIEKNLIQLRHDSVAENFFTVTGINRLSVLKKIITQHMLDEETVIKFERKVFSLSILIEPTLLRVFSKDEYYRHILTKYNRIHSLELAEIQQNGLHAVNRGEYIREQLGKSFQRIVASYKNTVSLWIRYYTFGIRSIEHIPDEMLQYISEGSGFYKRITQLLDDYLRLHFRWMDSEDRRRAIIVAEEVFNYIINTVDTDDLPARLCLLWIYRNRGEVERAKRMVDEIGSLPVPKSEVDFAISFIKNYDEEVRELLEKDRKDPRIRKTNHYIINYFEDIIDYWAERDKYSNDYVKLIRNYARFLSNAKYYDKAYQILKSAIDDFEKYDHQKVEISTLYIECGMICQISNERNPHRSRVDAVKWFEKAADKLNGRALLYALKPMCKTYLVLNEYDKVLELCERIRQLDKWDREVDTLNLEAIRLKRVRDFKLPVSNAFEYVASENFRDAFFKLLSDLTPEQKIYAKLWGLKEEYDTPGAKGAIYKIATSIRNNRYISGKYLSRLQVRKDKALWETQINDDMVLQEQVM